MAKLSTDTKFWNEIPQILGQLNKSYNNASVITPYSHKSSNYSNSEYARLADKRVKLSLDKLGSRMLQKTIESKFGKLDDSQLLSIYRGLQENGHIPKNSSEIFDQLIFDYSNASFAALLENASVEEIKEAYGENTDLTKSILAAKKISDPEDRFNKLSGFGDDNFDQINRPKKDSSLAKYFNFYADGVNMLKNVNDLESMGVFTNNKLNEYVENKKDSYEAYRAKLNNLVSKLSDEDLTNAWNVGNSRSSYSSQSNSDSFQRRIPQQYANNPYAARLYSQAHREINFLHSNPRAKTHYLNGLGGNPFATTNIYNNPYDINTNNSLDDYYNSLWGG